MTQASGMIYFADHDGNLYRVGLVAGSPDAGTLTAVSGPGIDGRDWRANGLFVFNP